MLFRKRESTAKRSPDALSSVLFSGEAAGSRRWLPRRRCAVCVVVVTEGAVSTATQQQRCSVFKLSFPVLLWKILLLFLLVLHHHHHHSIRVLLAAICCCKSMPFSFTLDPFVRAIYPLLRSFASRVGASAYPSVHPSWHWDPLFSVSLVTGKRATKEAGWEAVCAVTHN